MFVQVMCWSLKQRRVCLAAWLDPKMEFVQCGPVREVHGQEVLAREVRGQEVRGREVRAREVRGQEVLEAAHN